MMTAPDSPDPEGMETWQIRPFRTLGEFRACVALQERENETLSNENRSLKVQREVLVERHHLGALPPRP